MGSPVTAAVGSTTVVPGAQAREEPGCMKAGVPKRFLRLELRELTCGWSVPELSPESDIPGV